MKTITDLDAFTRAYLTCILFAESDNADESGGEPLDANYSLDDFAPEAIASALQDCEQFQKDNEKDLATAYASDFLDTDRAGHNYWLNRNGHGSGFWDEYSGHDADLHATFERLSEASKANGSLYVYVGDDEKLHLS